MEYNWIRVGDEYPDMGKRVIVYAEQRGALFPFVTKSIEIGSWCGKSIGWIMDDGMTESATVTHWMPLPDKP